MVPQSIDLPELRYSVNGGTHLLDVTAAAEQRVH
jgi:hypothetical protein